MTCDCGGCCECLRDQGSWGEACVYCGAWVDFDRHEVTTAGDAHLHCEQRHEELLGCYDELPRLT